MKLLKYKGIVFDEWVDDEETGLWAEMCQGCAERHHDKVAAEIDDGGTARGCCSVRGCFNDGSDDEKNHYYIDFKPEYVSFVEADESDDYDQQYI